jgi:hypothetical protein
LFDFLKIGENKNMSISKTLYDLSLSISDTAYKAVENCLDVQHEETNNAGEVTVVADEGIKKYAKIAASVVLYPLLGLIALVEAVVRIPLALVGKAIIFFIPKDLSPIANRIETVLLNGPAACVTALMNCLQKLFEQLGQKEAKKIVEDANVNFLVAYVNATTPIATARINTVFGGNTAPNTNNNAHPRVVFL